MSAPDRSPSAPLTCGGAAAPAAIVPLAALRPGEGGVVHGLRTPAASAGHARQLVLRLLEIGFVEGEPVRVTAIGPGGREPLAVRIAGSLFALRRHEAEQVLVLRNGGVA